MMDNAGLVEKFKDLGVDIELRQFRDGKPPHIDISYKDAKEFAYDMMEARNERIGLRFQLEAANERLAKRSDITTHRLDPDQFERLGDIFTLPTERERELQTRVEHLETEANQRSQGLDGMPLPRSNY